MGKKFLFINNVDLVDTDANGRTLRDVFSFVKDEDILSFCISRKNPKLKPNQVFCVNEKHIFHLRKMLKSYFCEPSITVITNGSNKKPKKNPLTCILRNIVWKFNFMFFKKDLKKWLLTTKPDYIVFDPSDFIFFHKIACFISKICGKKLIIYNTEDFYFKTWNYLHNENGFSFLYPLFRRRLIKSYRKSFSTSCVCLHNVEGLRSIYEKEFPFTKHYVVYHPSTVVGKKSVDLDEPMNFYYCGALEKGRDKVMVSFAKALANVSPKSKIYFNGNLLRDFNDNFIKEIGNVVNLGFSSYEEVKKRLVSNYVLLSLASLDEYNAKDKYHVFSTKLSDYISSFNPIFHIGPIGDESNILSQYEIGFVCKDESSLEDCIRKCISELRANPNYLHANQFAFYKKYLNPEVVSKTVQELIG